MDNTVKDLITPEEISDLLKLNKKNFRFAILYLMKAIKLDKINTLYKNNSDGAEANFVDALLNKLNIKYEVNEKDMENIPESGAYITVSNHPYGGLDGLILLSILQKRRADFKIVANQFLNKIPELCDNFISVDPFRKNA
ncbi:MAG: 1-acyl-sn-glycerol-3-phosphate acyltransferase, partial [Ignavibacteria bacterium]|nr:1-acyl-sn-glycerol-3-phosphate acyltransferase [Ignavibacteria bacterium]